jgi:Replication initiator protein, pSAM2
MLGFGGHFFSKSKRYSTTFRALRNARTDYRWRHGRSERTDVQLAVDHDEDTVLVINTLAYVGIGWHTTGDAMLANTSAAMARERRRAAREAQQEHEAILDYVS